MDSIQNNVKEQQVQNQKDTRFDINDSIWIAAAAMTYEIYYKKQNAGQPIYVPDFTLVQADICNRTEVINGHKAESARTSQWCCGDHEKHTYCFLRAIEGKRRLSFPDEFGGKEEPESLKMSEVISTDVGSVTIQQLHDFVHKEYAALEEQVIRKTNIDYKAPLEYIDKHSEEEYAGPKKSVPPEQRAKMDELKASAQNAVEQIKKMMTLCEKRFNLKRFNGVNWLDNSYTKIKTKHYLWGQLKNPDNMDSPISISIFVDKNSETLQPRYRISLEIKNKEANKELMKQYHGYLDMEPDARHGLTYGGGSNESGYVKALEGNHDTIKAQIEAGVYNKVQYCKMIDRNDTYSNEDYERQVLEGVAALMPFYEHVVGISKSEYWPTKDEYDSDISVETWKEKKQNMNEAFPKNLILYGPPGTGKTYNTVKYAVAICEGKSLSEYDQMNYVDILRKYENYKAKGRIAFTTFHQSYGYEEFIEGIKPLLISDDAKKESKDIQYDVIPGLFKSFCQNASTKWVSVDEGEDEVQEPYVFIIDEINRGNISKIFGELITLIEETKRAGAEEAMETMLPYSGDAFSVPNNVYILGTMNTADRSIALMDTALRRRFDFEEMMPDSKVLSGVTIEDHGETIDIAKMLDIINERITFLYDREHTIGHAFFTKLIANASLAVLADIFRSKVVPLLQEYFYEDYAKIQLVLGDNDKSDSMFKFILDEPVKPKSIFKGNPEDIVDLPEKKYVIQDEAFEHIQSYIEIG